MNVKQFLAATPRQQAILFPKIKSGVDELVNKVLWSEFKKVNRVLVDECTSYVFEKLVTHHDTMQEGKERAFLYSMAKNYFRDAFFETKNRRTVLVGDVLFDNQNEDKFKFLNAEDHEDNLEAVKAEAVIKFQELIQGTNDRSSILIVCAIMECILTQHDYNAQFLSLFLLRKTDLNYDALYRALKRMSVKIALSTMEWFEKIFEMYATIEPFQTDENIVTDWEKRAIFYFEERHKRFRGENYEARHNRIVQRSSIRSTPIERISWIKSYHGNSLEGDYYKRFQKSHRTFKSDKRAAFN